MTGKLTLKQRKFCLAFVGEANGSGVEAARLAGYNGSNATLRAAASRNITKDNILSFIAQLRRGAEKRASDKILTATETLVGITKIAESDIADVFPDEPFLQEAKKRGVSKRIKSVMFDKDTGRLTKLEMYSGQTALQDMGKYHKLFPTKIEISKTEVDEVIEQAAREHGLPLPTTELESTM